MSYKRFDPEDIVLSVGKVSTPVWTGNLETVTKATLAIDSSQEASYSGNYYLDVYNTVVSGSSMVIDPDKSDVQFSIAYGSSKGSYSEELGNGKTYAETIYGQYRSLVLGDEDSSFHFQNTGSSEEAILVISLDRARYKERIQAGSLELKIKDRNNTSIVIEDSSRREETVKYLDSGQVWDLYVQGTTGDKVGILLVDIGVIILDAVAIGLIDRYSPTSRMTRTFFDSVFESITVRSEETITSNYVFVRARNAEFNYSINPSNITSTGEVRNSSMINDPQVYITSVGLYNDANDLLAVAKLSRPLVKDFTKESIIRIKLDF